MKKKLLSMGMVGAVALLCMGSLVSNAGWEKNKANSNWYYKNERNVYQKNTWVGNYFLKKNGVMASDEWVYTPYYGWYYFTKEGSYARNRWIRDYKGRWYWFNASGKYVTNTWKGDYFLKQNGEMASDEWVNTPYYGWYYFTKEGSYARNRWIRDYKGRWYWFNASGKYVTNTWKGNYFLKKDGVMASYEWVKTPNKGWFYFTKEGSFARNKWERDNNGKRYWFNANGRYRTKTSVERTTETKDYTNFDYDVVYDNTKAKGTNGIQSEGSQGYTTYNWAREVYTYSDGSVSTGSWYVESQNTVAPVNGVKWVGTYEEPAKTGYINDAVARDTAEAINGARVANGLKALPYNIVGGQAEWAYNNYWSKYGLCHIGNANECVAFWSEGQATVNAWMSDAHRESILVDDISSFSVGVYTDSDDASWTIYFVN